MSLALPAYLLGLAALALPWLLHRFGEQRAEQLDFASDRFLEAVPPPVSERHRLRYRLLFALRCLALLALCLLFARPWLAIGEPRGAPRTLHAAVLDTSLSMRTGDRFDRARDALDRRLAGLPAEDRVRLHAFGQRLQAIGDEAGSPAQARTDLATLEPGHGRGDFGQLMRELDAIGSRAELPVAALFATDLQASALPVRRNDLFAPSLASFELIDGGDDRPTVNVRVDATASTADRASARVQVELGVAAGPDARAGGADDGGALVGMLIVEHGNERLHAEPVTLSASQPWRPWRRTLDALTLPPSPTDALTVRFAGERDDALPDDDVQRVALRRERPFQVSLSGIGASLPERARLFLTTAFEGDRSAEVRRASGGAQRLADDTDLAVVAIEPGDAQALAAVRGEVRRGTDILLIPAAVDGTLAPDDAVTVRFPERGVAVDAVVGAHPLGAAGIDWFGVRRYAPARFAAEQGDRVLVASEGREPMLVERDVGGRGRLLLLDDPLDGEASNLPFEPAFVELLDAVRRWADSDGALPERIHSGASLPLPDGVQVLDPQGEALLALDERASAERLVLDEPGLYRVLDVRGERVIEVVTDARESRLEPMDGAVRTAWQARHDDSPGGTDAMSAEGSADDAASGTGTTSGPETRRIGAADQRWLLVWLLPVLVLLVLGESLLGNRRLDVRREG